jgi:hypothetical protein
MIGITIIIQRDISDTVIFSLDPVFTVIAADPGPFFVVGSLSIIVRTTMRSMGRIVMGSVVSFASGSSHPFLGVGRESVFAKAGCCCSPWFRWCDERGENVLFRLLCPLSAPSLPPSFSLSLFFLLLVFVFIIFVFIFSGIVILFIIIIIIVIIIVVIIVVIIIVVIVLIFILGCRIFLFIILSFSSISLFRCWFHFTIFINRRRRRRRRRRRSCGRSRSWSDRKSISRNFTKSRVIGQDLLDKKANFTRIENRRRARAGMCGRIFPYLQNLVY